MSYIYESPDQGQTVYRRKIGSPDRELHYESDAKKELTRRQDRWILWQNILRAAETDPGIEHLLSQAEMLYWLGKDNEI